MLHFSLVCSACSKLHFSSVCGEMHVQCDAFQFEVECDVMYRISVFFVVKCMCFVQLIASHFVGGCDVMYCISVYFELILWRNASAMRCISV